MNVLNVYLKRLDNRDFFVYLRLLNKKLISGKHFRNKSWWLFHYSETNIREL